MKVMLLTPEIHFHSPIVLKTLFSRLACSDYSFKVILTPKFRSKGTSSSSLYGVICRSGLLYLLSMTLLKLKYDCLRFCEILFRVDFESRRFLTPEEVCEHFGVEYKRCTSVNSPEGLDAIGCFEPEIIFSVFFNQILEAEILGIPHHGCFNLHPSLLPAYKGMSPILWMLADGAVAGGVSLHFMNEQIDNGEVVATSRFDILPQENFFLVYTKAAIAGASIILNFIEDNVGQHHNKKGNNSECVRTYGPITRDAFMRVLKRSSFFKFKESRGL